MSRGLTDDVLPEDPQPSMDDLLEVILSVFFAVDSLNRKLDAVLAHYGLQAAPVQVVSNVEGD